VSGIGELALLTANLTSASNALIATAAAWRAACETGDTASARQHWKRVVTLIETLYAVAKAIETRQSHCT